MANLTAGKQQATAPLWLDSKLLEEIREHGARDYPHETCGALLGVEEQGKREVRSLFPIPNHRIDSPHNRFEITSDDSRAAERAADRAGLQVIGWYHSHPDHPAQPSEYDREHAWPWYSYIIVRVAGCAAGELTSWLLDEDRSHFTQQDIQTS